MVAGTPNPRNRDPGNPAVMLLDEADINMNKPAIPMKPGT